MKLDDVRKELTGKSGRRFWKSLEELSNRDGFRDMLNKEAPRLAAEWDPVNRRDFLRLMGASLALGGLTACTRQPREKIIPYVQPPEEIVPGKPLFFATSMPFDGYGIGLLAESHMGRPTKVEGNPEHPASLGSTDALIQASILNMYDPDRAQSVRYLGRISTWANFTADVDSQMGVQAGKEGAGLRIVTGPVTSPTLQAQLDELLQTYPKAAWIQYGPVTRDNVYAGAELAFGKRVEPVYDFSRADVILSLDADFIGWGPGRIRYSRDFTARRKASENVKLNRLYAVESHVTTTGASADHRLPLTYTEIGTFARALAHELGVQAPVGAVSGHDEWLKALAGDLKHAGAGALVIAGDQQPPEVHAIAHAINVALGSVGATVRLVDPVIANAPDQTASLGQLAADLEAGAVDALIMIGVNPVYDAPGDLSFEKWITNVPFTAQVSLSEDETTPFVKWHIPLTHYLEMWSDTRAYDGTVSTVQPLIAPLYDGKSPHEVVAALAGSPDATGYDLVQNHWKRVLGDGFDTAWSRAVHDGFFKDSALEPVSVSLTWNGEADAVAETEGDLDLTIVPDPCIWDGLFSNNGWMQELPKPITTLTWDNVLLLSIRTAGRLGLDTGHVAEVNVDGRAVRIPVLLAPGIADGAGVITLGYGRTAAGRVGNGVGVSARPLRSVASPWHAKARIGRTRNKHVLAMTQDHHTMQGRNHLRVGTAEQFDHDPDFVAHMEHFTYDQSKSIYPRHDYSKSPQWGMVIDLSACTGCNACVIACQSENNIPVVGKKEVLNGREMHWIRIDRYFEGTAADAQVHHQPMTCVQCENAPCEAVCPVAATVHSHDGINQMVYNRCVGTRYCSNNCPYKVRRFNFFKFADHDTPSYKLQRNPDVTVRSRGVMEKCTYCVQRISFARIRARRENREIRDGEVVTACQQACPSRAISFGDILDPNSEVSKKRAGKLNYGVLTELGTAPRTTFLARITNPNPALQSESDLTESHHHGV